ncbi:hypothetical protein ABZY57_25690 [Streptomyces sp. NPDC006450]|uniref:hypothetical protein n=1 Tax=Streptomyces sp. NPDC006450 TaxID=3155458 RepID=UPI0033AF7755
MRYERDERGRVVLQQRTRLSRNDAQIKKARESRTSPARLSRHFGDHGRDLNAPERPRGAPSSRG